MNEDFSWVTFYPAVCNGLKKYASDRGALLAFLFEKLPEETTYLHNPEGVKVRDIDPFTFLGVMNRHISDPKKSLVAEAFKEFFEVKEPIPQNFHGIPPLSNENSMFFSFKDGKTAEDIQNLWNFFLALLGNSQDVGSMFDRLTTTQYGIKFNLTIGMYWVCPDVYFPLDGPSRRFLQEHGIEVGHKVPSFAEYKTIIEEVKSKVCEKSFNQESFAKITRSIFLNDIVKK